MDQVHAACRRRHLSPRTEEADRYWIRHFIFFRGKRHPRELREAEVTQFLNHLAVQRHVAVHIVEVIGRNAQAFPRQLFEPIGMGPLRPFDRNTNFAQ